MVLFQLLDFQDSLFIFLYKIIYIFAIFLLFET